MEKRPDKNRRKAMKRAYTKEQEQQAAEARRSAPPDEADSIEALLGCMMLGAFVDDGRRLGELWPHREMCSAARSRTGLTCSWDTHEPRCHAAMEWLSRAELVGETYWTMGEDELRAVEVGLRKYLPDRRFYFTGAAFLRFSPEEWTNACRAALSSKDYRRLLLLLEGVQDEDRDSVLEMVEDEGILLSIVFSLQSIHPMLRYLDRTYADSSTDGLRKDRFFSLVDAVIARMSDVDCLSAVVEGKPYGDALWRVALSRISDQSVISRFALTGPYWLRSEAVQRVESTSVLWRIVLKDLRRLRLQGSVPHKAWNRIKQGTSFATVVETIVIKAGALLRQVKAMAKRFLAWPQRRSAVRALRALRTTNHPPRVGKASFMTLSQVADVLVRDGWPNIVTGEPEDGEWRVHGYYRSYGFRIEESRVIYFEVSHHDDFETWSVAYTKVGRSRFVMENNPRRVLVATTRNN